MAESSMLRSGAGSTLTAKRLESCADRKGLSLWVERWGRHAQTIKLGGNQVSELKNKNACIFRHSGSDLQTLRFIDATGWREHKPRLSSSSSSLLSSCAVQYDSAVASGNGRPMWSLQRNNVDNACLRSVIRLGRTQNVTCWIRISYYVPTLYVGALSDDAVWRLSVWRLSRTSGLSREQRGLGRLKLAQR